MLQFRRFQHVAYVYVAPFVFAAVCSTVYVWWFTLTVRRRPVARHRDDGTTLFVRTWRGWRAK